MIQIGLICAAESAGGGRQARLFEASSGAQQGGKGMKRKINIGVLAHVDAGKTSLTEQLLFYGGALRSAGAVDLGTAQTDTLAVERTRGISVKTADAVLETETAVVNLIDTPGHADFISEVERALSVLDCAVLVISAVEGVQAQTEVLLGAVQRLKLPCVAFVNKLDRAGSDFEAACAALSDLLAGRTLLVVNRPEHEGSPEAAPVRAADCLENAVVLAEDEALLERYLAGGAVDFPQTVRAAVGNGAVPVLCGSSKTGAGCRELLDFLCACVPEAPQADGEFLARVFRVEHDKGLGKLAHVRVFSGSIEPRQSVYLPRCGAEEKVAGIRRPLGRRQADVPKAEAGDIAVLFGLSSVRAGDVLGRGALPRAESTLAVPLLTVKAEPETPAEITALAAALSALADEDPALRFEWVREKREIQLRIVGKIQLEILGALLLERYGLKARFSAPSVIYKETPARAGEGYADYLAPKPCWAVLRFRIEPLPRGSGLVYESQASPARLLYRYQNHVETAVPEALLQGLFGWEVTDLKVTLLDGEHHHVHTHPLDFFVCTPMAIMDGLKNCGTTLLEPILRVRAVFDPALSGRVIGLLQNARGTLLSQAVRGERQLFEAEVPAADSLELPVEFAKLPGGRGSLSAVFSHYAPCPPGFTAERERIGVNPLDRAKYILEKRNALAT